MLRIILFFLLIPTICLAQIPERKNNTYINDYTNHLTDAEIQNLNELLRIIENETTVQVAIILIDRLPENSSIEDYARLIGNEWKVGTNKNGIVYVAALNDRKQRLEIARNSEGQIPDVIAAEIIDNLKPNLRNEAYYLAMDLLIRQIAEHLNVNNISLKKNYTASSTKKEKSIYDKQKEKYDSYANYAIAFIILGLIIFLIWAKIYRKKYFEMYTRNGVYYGVGSSYYEAMSDAYDEANGISGGFGSFGGSGGGGFSGGGASGSW